jgi:hypothetical protein
MLENIMVSKYFELKTSKEEFKQNITELTASLKNKKVLIFGIGDGFLALDKIYELTKKLNIVAITDKIFNQTHQNEWRGIRAIPVGQIIKQDFDFILVTSEHSKKNMDFLYTELGIQPKKVKTIFTEKIKEEALNTEYLYKNNFDKTLPKLIKKLKNKNVILYGAGSYLEVIKEFFDLSELNIIGVSDKRFSKQNCEKEFLGYRTIAPDKISELNPDCVLVSTKYYIRITDDLYKKFKGTKIKVKPLVKKSFLNIYKEIREM